MAKKRNIQEMITFLVMENVRIKNEIEKRELRIGKNETRLEELREKLKVKEEKEKKERETEEKIQKLKAEIRALRGGRNNGDGQKTEGR